MFEGKIAKAVGGGMFPEKELLKIVHNHAMIAAIIVALPLPTIEQILFICVLWHMYSALAKYVGQSLGCASIIVGVVVNIGFMIVYSIALEFIPFLGWLTSAGICYLQFYLSGKAYIETLRNM